MLSFFRRQHQDKKPRTFQAHEELKDAFASLGLDFDQLDSSVFFALHQEAVVLGGAKAAQNFKLIMAEVSKERDEQTRTELLKTIYLDRGDHLTWAFSVKCPIHG